MTPYLGGPKAPRMRLKPLLKVMDVGGGGEEGVGFRRCNLSNLS